MPLPSRLSYPPENASLFPPSPTASRGTRSSSVFPYSLARPPTNYSEASWLPKHSARSKPSHPPPQRSTAEDDELEDGETPLYARSDWDDDTPKADRHQGHRELVASPSLFRSSRGSGGSLGSARQGQRRGGPHQVGRDGEPSETTAWSRSSYGGGMTSRFTPGPGALGGIAEEEEESPVYPTYTQAGVVASPGAMTPLPATPWTAATMERQSPHSPHSPAAVPLPRHSGELFISPGRPLHSRSRSASSLPKIIATHMLAKKGQSAQFQGHRSFDSEFARKQAEKQSTLPSLLDLEYLTGGYHSPDPFADPLTHRQIFRNMTPAHSAFPPVPPIPDDDDHGPGGGNLMTPGAQQRLGRMSVAPARYSLHAKKKTESRSSKSSGSDEKSSLRPSLKVGSRLKSWQSNVVVRFYMTWRSFIVAALALISALLLTISLQNTQSEVSSVVKVQPRLFNVGAANPQPVGLGVSGWCQLAGTYPDCRDYEPGDFANADRSFKLPGDTLLPAMGGLYNALTATTWLLAMYTVITAFFHFYLFFALSIPFSHLVDETAPLPRDKSHPGDPDEKDEFELKRMGKDAVQVEVDIRAKCERPPFESYIWVWWAWWGHRRSPVGAIFSLVQGVMALSSFAAAVAFYKRIVGATSEEGVTLGGAALVPFLVHLFTLDPFISSARWVFHASRSWSTFLHPPEPSAAAIMLPAPRKMVHIRPTTERSSFFAARTLAPTTAYGATRASAIPPMPGQELDEETRRWLVAYPSDPELVPLIAALRGGEDNDDFLLSEVGLVYLRPDAEDEAALLVPPAGEIRRELIEDAHIPLPPDKEVNPDELEHRTVEDILAELNETFWWMTMEQDVVEYVKTCEECARRRIELKPGMTAVDYTGVTVWTAGGKKTAKDKVGESAMAAEMAFAMRKAEEEARVGPL